MPLYEHAACGNPTLEPSALMGRAWCRSCEEYIVPTEVKDQVKEAVDESISFV